MVFSPQVVGMAGVAGMAEESYSYSFNYKQLSLNLLAVQLANKS